MIDIHCHVLHEIDDGAYDITESLELCENAVRGGIHTLILTPHCYDLLAASDVLLRREEKMAELSEMIARQKIPLTLYAGVEAHLSDDLFYLNQEQLEALSLNNSRYILSELSALSMPESVVLDYVRVILEHGMIPVMAHPERIGTFRRNPDLIAYLSEMGVLFQVTIGSAVGKFGEHSYQLAHWMLENGLADCLATDAHSMEWRTNSVEGALDYLSRYLSADYLHSMLETIPRMIIENCPVQKYHSVG